jgi:hypothetical protein
LFTAIRSLLNNVRVYISKHTVHLDMLVYVLYI